MVVLLDADGAGDGLTAAGEAAGVVLFIIVGGVLLAVCVPL
jgi:hypothetical protein